MESACGGYLAPSVGRGEWERPFEPHVEIRRRRRGILVLGLVLVIAGFLLPVITVKMDVQWASGSMGCGRRGVGPTVTSTKSFDFPNFQAFSTARVPWMLRFFLMFPLPAGIALIVLSRTGSNRTRAIGVLSAGAVFFLVLFVAQFFDQMGGSRDVPAAVTMTARQGNMLRFLTSWMLILGWLGVFVGTRTRWYRPGNLVAPWFARIGGMMLALGFLMPILPKEFGYVLLLLPFLAICQAGGWWMGFWLLTWIGLTITAAVLAFGTGRNIHAVNAHALSGRAFRLLILGLVLFGVALALEFLWVIKSDLTMLPVGFFAAIKALGWLGGILLLLPFGMIDLLLSDPPPVKPPVEERPPSIYPGATHAEAPGFAMEPAGSPTQYAQPSPEPVAVDTSAPTSPPQDEESELNYWPEPSTVPDETEAVPADTVDSDEAHLPDDVREGIEKLKQFREREMLTEEEYRERREKLLAQSRT